MKKPEPSALEQEALDSAQDESFLRRWSQRKLAVSTANEERKGDDLHPETDTGNDPSVPDQAQHELTDEDMPPLESLDENSDYSAFFSPKVSETLRQQALRKLFHFQKFNVSDGLNDYDDDYTQFENLGNIVTHEMKRIIASETEKLKADLSLDEMTEDKTMAINTEN